MLVGRDVSLHPSSSSSISDDTIYSKLESGKAKLDDDVAIINKTRFCCNWHCFFKSKLH